MTHCAPPDLRAAIDALVERKKAAEEIDEGPAVPIINQFIDTELAACPPSPTPCPNPAAASATSTPFSTTSTRKCK
ncbi:MAG: nucleotidyltransferase domain-containing protein [Opitutaceae bacterium]